MRSLVVASNMYNEVDQLGEWFDFVLQITPYVLIVDTGSTDGTIQYCEQRGAKVVTDDIIRREGYGPARNQLRMLSLEKFGADWCLFLDADERIDECDFHKLRFIKDYLINDYDVVGFPRIDWLNKERTGVAKSWLVNPDWQARMTRIDSPLRYIRRLHEQVIDFNKIYVNVENPKINHFHRSRSQEKNVQVGKICAYLHNKDKEFGHTYPEHHKEAYFRDLVEKEGL